MFFTLACEQINDTRGSVDMAAAKKIAKRVKIKVKKGFTNTQMYDKITRFTNRQGLVGGCVAGKTAMNHWLSIYVFNKNSH